MLEDFNEKTPVTSRKPAEWPYYLWILVTVILFGYGYFGIYLMIVGNPELLSFVSLLLNTSMQTIGELLPLTIITFLTIGIVAIIGAYALLQLFAALGEEFLLFVYFGIPGIIALFGGYMIIKGGFVGILFLIPLLIVIIVRKKLITAAKLFEYSVEQVTGNLQTTIPMIIVGIIKVLLWTGFFSAEIYTQYLLKGATQEVRYLAGLVVFFVYLFVVYGFTYYFEAANVFIFNNVYHNSDERGLREAFKVVKEMRGAIIGFAFMMALVQLIRKITRDVTNRGRRDTNKNERGAILWIIGMGLAYLMNFLFGVFMFLNYYTLVVIMVKRKPLKEATKESVKLLPRTMVTSIAGNVGIAAAELLYKFLVIIILTISGYYYGTWISIRYNLANLNLIIGIFMAILFSFIGYGPMVSVFQPVFTAYKTFLFNAALDLLEGRPLPQHIPLKLREALSEVINSLGMEKVSVSF